jgi:hypothetical protein
MLAGVWLFAALASLKTEGVALTAYGICVVLAFLVHWTSALFAGAIGVYLLAAWLRRRDPATGRALAATAAAGIAGIAVLAFAMSYLQGSWRNAWEHLARSFAVRSAAIPAAAWWARQRGYFDANFTAGAAGVCLLIAVFLGARPCGGGRDRADLPRRSPAGVLLLDASRRVIGSPPSPGASF